MENRGVTFNEMMMRLNLEGCSRLLQATGSKLLCGGEADVAVALSSPAWTPA